MDQKETKQFDGLDPDDIIDVIPLDDIQNGNVDLDEVLKNGVHHDMDEGDDDEIDYIEEDEEETQDDAVAHIRGHEKDVFTLDLLDGRYLVCGSEDDSASVWDLTKDLQNPAFFIKNHKDSVTQVKFNASKRLLATGDMSGKIVITDLLYQAERCVLDDLSDLEWMVWHPQADILFAGGADAMTMMWLISEQGVARSKVYMARGGTCAAGKLIKEGSKLLCGYQDGTARIWNLKDSTHLEIVLGSPVTSIDCHKLLNIAAIGTVAGKVTLINTDSGKTIRVFDMAIVKPDGEEEDEESLNTIETLTFHSSESWLAVGVNRGTLTIYDTTTGVNRFDHALDNATCVKAAWYITPHSKVLLITANSDGTITVFDGKNGTLQKTIHGGSDEIYDFVVDGDGNGTKIFTACAEGVVRVFDC